MGTVVDTSLDDPRWNGAIANSGNFTTATAPMHVRSMWKGNYIYLSFISDLATSSGMGGGEPRDIFLGFRRATPQGTEQAYIFQFHLAANGTQTAQAMPACSTWKTDSTFECNDATAKPNYMRVFVDNGTQFTCGSVVMGEAFKQTAVPSWLTNNVHVWQTGSRWAVQMRLKLDDADPSNANQQLHANPTLEQGLEWAPAGIWYETTQSVAPDNLLSLLRLPTSNTGSFSRCAQPPSSDRIVHSSLAASGAPEWNALTLVGKAGATAPADCDTGLFIDRAHLGTLVNGAIDINFKAKDSAGNDVANTVIARVTNGTGSTVTGNVKALFKIADWGSTVAGTGDWIDIPARPASSSNTNPVQKSVSIPAGGTADLTFNWTLTPEEYCKYSLNVPGYLCEDCAAGSCTDAQNPCRRVKKPDGSYGTCQTVRTRSHQCISVALSAPNTNVKFSQALAFNNMDFGEMSAFAQDATIDVRGAPLVGASRDVILIVQARNMPAPPKTKPPRSSGLELLTNNSLKVARQIAGAHAKSLQTLGTAELDKRKVGRTALTLAKVNSDVRFKELGASDVVAFDRRRITLPTAEYQLTGDLVNIAADAVQASKVAGANKPAAELTRKLVHTVGPRIAAQIVPTIEVYPFYRPAKGNVYQPMQPFSVFLSHDGPLLGFKVSDLVGADGATVTKLATNTFQLKVPSAQTKARVTVKAESVDPPTTVPVMPHHGPGPHPPVVNPVTPPKPLKPLKPNWKLP